MGYVDGYFPDVYRVAGIALRPLTVGHAMLLERMGCALAVWAEGREEPVPEEVPAPDVALYAVVLSRPWREAEDLLLNRVPQFRREIKRLCRRVKYDERAVGSVMRHLMDAMSAPKFVRWENAKGQASGAGILHGLMLTLLELGVSRNEVLDTPLRVALWDSVGASERKGHITMEPEADARQLREALKRNGR